MSEISEEDAEAFGLKLDPDQRDLLHGQHRLAMIAQVIPDPRCWVNEGTRVPFMSCLPDHSMKRVAVPTVVEIAPPEIAEHELTGLDVGHTYRRNGWDVLPNLPVFAKDMVDIALGNDCYCLEKHGEVACGCNDDGEYLQVVSPYACVPLTVEEAKAIDKAATRGMSAGAFVPLVELSEIESGMRSNEELLATRYDQEVRDLIDALEAGEADENDIEELAMKPALEALGWEPPEHLHVPSSGISYLTPEGLQDKVARLAGLQRRNWRLLQRLLKRDPKALISQGFAQFAYPCMDQSYINEMY